MHITVKEIKNNIEPLYYKRGVDYYSARRVLSYQEKELYDDNDMLYTNIFSTVRGSGGCVYSQDIDIYMDIDTIELVIEGSCSCPVSYNCKHVAAVCISYRTDSMSSQIAKLGGKVIVPSHTNTSLVDNWLKNLKKSTSKETQKDSKTNIQNRDYFLTYRLDGLKSNDRNRVYFYKSKILKNGSISRGTKLDENNIGHSYTNRELKNSEDENILKMTDAFIMSDYYNSKMEPLSGTLGYMIVKKVLETQRCYFDYNSIPLSLVDGIFHAKYEFKLYKGEYSLKSNIDKKDFRVIETTPPFLMNTIENTVQELDIDIEVYQQLLNAPKIPKDEIAKIYTSVANVIPNIDLETSL